jgi:rod shape-determining protein MreC
VLVTSGIDGIYPQGIPVAKVVKIERDPAYPFAHVTCLPVAGVDKHRHLLILSSLPALPDRPNEKSAAANADNRVKARKNN